MKEILAIIPARGGSKGIPRKNLFLLAGKPLIAHTIEQALLACSVNRVIVSTDDSEISSISEQSGAEVVCRPAEISGDTDASELALLHTLTHLSDHEGYEPDVLVFLQCTSPLVTAEDIEGAITTFYEMNADSALTVTPVHCHLWRKGDGGWATSVNHDMHQRLPRQLAETQYRETGGVYVMMTDGFRNARHRFFGRTALHVMPPERSWEIDEPLDLEIVKLLRRKQEQRFRMQVLPMPIEALVSDFDGVFTDNRVLVNQDGIEAVRVDRSDGLGISLLRNMDIRVLVLSAEKNPVVMQRCKKLGIECLQGCDSKLPALQAWMSDAGIDASRVLYVGNDINDVDCLRYAGVGIAVADAHESARAAAQIVLEHSGGRGAIRELVDLIAQRRREHHAR